MAGVFSLGISFRGLSRAALEVSMRAIHSPQLIVYHRPLPGPDDPSFLRAQPSLTYPPAHETPHPEVFTVTSSNPNAHTFFDFYGRPHQTDHQPVPYNTFSFNPQDSGPMPTLMPSTHQPSAPLNAGRSLTYNGLHGCSSAVSEFLQSRVCVACLCSIPTV